MKRNQLLRQGLVAGATEPVTVDDVKNWSAIDTTLDDTIIEGIISGARVMCENYASNDSVSQSYEYFVPEPHLEEDGYYYVELPRRAAENGIINIKDADGNFESVDWEFYGIDRRTIKLVNGYEEWVSIEFESQATESASHLQTFKSAIKTVVEQIYDNRANLEGDEDIMILEKNTKKMLHPVKYFKF